MNEHAQVCAKFKFNAYKVHKYKERPTRPHTSDDLRWRAVLYGQEHIMQKGRGGPPGTAAYV